MTTLTNLNDIHTGTAASETIYALGGHDIVNGGAGNDTIWGGSGDDFLTGGLGNDTLIGGSCIDTAGYLGASHRIVANLMTGTVLMNGETDTLLEIENIAGSNHSDSIMGNAAANLLSGNGGHDTISGNSGNDQLFGGAGDDSLIGGTGGDVINGGAGNDTAYYYESNVGVAVSLLLGLEQGGHAQGDTLSGVENVTGSTHDDYLQGSTYANILFGEAGDDLLEGMNGNDSLLGGDGDDQSFGGNGDDTIYGGAGADTISGGANTDTVDYGASLEGVSVDLDDGEGSGGDAEGDTISGVESVWGSYYSDEISGDSFANLLRGMAGDDELNGRDGADVLYGGHGQDTLDGGDGNDVIVGGESRDTMSGGDGLDTFVFASRFDSGTDSATRDRILGFQQDLDFIDLSGIDANGGLSGNQAFSFLGEGDFSGSAGELLYRQANDRTYIEADIDGDAEADFSILLSTEVNLTASDFIL